MCLKCGRCLGTGNRGFFGPLNITKVQCYPISISVFLLEPTKKVQIPFGNGVRGDFSSYFMQFRVCILIVILNM